MIFNLINRCLEYGVDDMTLLFVNGDGRMVFCEGFEGDSADLWQIEYIVAIELLNVKHVIRNVKFDRRDLL